MSTIALHPTARQSSGRTNQPDTRWSSGPSNQPDTRWSSGPRNEARIETPAPLRLTRRGRIVVGALFLTTLLAVAIVFGARSAATGEAGAPVATETVVVGSGDTLWGIASAAAEPGHTREMMLRIKELNALSSSTLQPGQELAVPKR